MAREYQLKPASGSPEGQPQSSEPEQDTLSRQLAILEALADGVDPFTGEELPDENLYQNAKVLRALLAAMEALKKERVREARKGALPAKAGNPWNDEEDQIVIERFEGGMSFRDLAKEHGRTEGAIKSRLTKLGKLLP